MLDIFYGYNQILVSPYDRQKITFTTPWGTFMYAKFPFGLINDGATFQREMDPTFVGKIKNSSPSLDDLIVFSESDAQHIKYLKKFFERCKKFGISLNPKKSIFSLKQGKLLGHIISKE